MSSIEWFIGAAIALTTLIGGIIVRDRQVMKSINDGDSKLHEKLDRVAETYVRRDDLNGHIQSIENICNQIRTDQSEATRQMREEQRTTNSRIDELLTAISKR